VDLDTGFAAQASLGDASKGSLVGLQANVAKRPMQSGDCAAAGRALRCTAR
jgi:hypothetical protein